MSTDLTLTLYETAETEDGIVRLDFSDMHLLGVSSEDIIAVEGIRRTYLTVQPSLLGDRNQRLAGVSAQTARNLGCGTGQKVRLMAERMPIPLAEYVTLQASDDLDQIHVMSRKDQIAGFWHRRALVEGDEMFIPTLDSYPLKVRVTAIQPAGPVRVGHGTVFTVGTEKTWDTFLKIGGLRDSYRACQTLAQTRFKKSGALAAHSVLLTGPEGCGKSRLVARLAQDMEVAFQRLDAYQLVDRWLAQGPMEMGGFLVELAKRGKTILLIDHLESLTISNSKSSRISAAIRSVTAQIAALLDEVTTQPDIMVFGIASGPLEERLQHNQRFDVEIQVDPPNRWGREEILRLATDSLPLAEDVDLPLLACLSAGMTAQDLNKMVRTAALKATESKIKASDFMAAFRTITPSAAQDVYSDIPPTLWSEVAGLDDVKQLLRETVSWSITQQDKFVGAGVRPPRTILLSGGEGTGKTSLVRALAGYMPIHFIEVSCPVLTARGMDHSRSYLTECFKLARRKAPCMIFFDDIDAFFESVGEQDGESPHQHGIVSQLLVEMDSLSQVSGIVVIAATNRPDRLIRDVLKPGRFDYALTLPMPDLAARKKILQIHARKLPLSADVDFDYLAGCVQGMSSAEIANLCNRVGLMALRQSINKPGDGGTMPVVNAELFEQALRGRKN